MVAASFASVGLSHRFLPSDGSRLQIDAVNAVALGEHDQLFVYDPQFFDEDPLDALLPPGFDECAEDRDFPKLFSAPRIPSLDVCAATIVVGSRVAHFLVNDGLHLWDRCAFGVGQVRKQN